MQESKTHLEFHACFNVPLKFNFEGLVRASLLFVPLGRKKMTVIRRWWWRWRWRRKSLSYLV